MIVAADTKIIQSVSFPSYSSFSSSHPVKRSLCLNYSLSRYSCLKLFFFVSIRRYLHPQAVVDPFIVRKCVAHELWFDSKKQRTFRGRKKSFPPSRIYSHSRSLSTIEASATNAPSHRDSSFSHQRVISRSQNSPLLGKIQTQSSFKLVTQTSNWF